MWSALDAWQVSGLDSLCYHSRSRLQFPNTDPTFRKPIYIVRMSEHVRICRFFFQHRLSLGSLVRWRWLRSGGIYERSRPGKLEWKAERAVQAVQDGVRLPTTRPGGEPAGNRWNCMDVNNGHGTKWAPNSKLQEEKRKTTQVQDGQTKIKNMAVFFEII